MAPHNTITFSGNNNQGFQLGVNQETIGEVVFNLKEENDKCLNDLRLTNPRDDKERIKDTKGGLLEGSYKWILRHPDFQRWRNDDQSRLLWIKGDPGKGKTMLLIGIIDELERQLAQIKQAEQGLIYLLAVQQPSLASNLREEYDHSSSKLYEDTNASVALSKILKGMLRDPTLARGYIIIDALDECETGMQQLLKLVVENTSASSVKWMVSSRNRHDIEQQLKLDDSQTKLSLELKANAEYVSHAVGVYIDDRVSQLESLQDGDAPRDQVRHILRRKAADTFLWVALVVQELKAVASWDVLDVLEEIPTGLEELYARMMKQIQQLKRGNPEFCRLMLSTATLAYRPLHMLELSVLSGLPEKISNKAQRVLVLVSMCGSFLTVREDRVYIIHQSAKDYLMSDIATTTVFPTATAEAHRDIFLRSLQTMRKTLRRDIYSLRHPGFSIDDLKMPVPDPLASVRYSCVHWIDHLCEAPHRNGLVDGGLAHKFLEGYLLYWAEALSLLGALSDAVLAVGNLERLLKTMSTESILLSLTVDAQVSTPQWISNQERTASNLCVGASFQPDSLFNARTLQERGATMVFTGPGVGKHWDPLVRTLESQDDSVWSVAFSPDGKLIASGSDDRTIKVWDAATGEVKRTLEGHHNSVLSVAFSLDGKLIASGSDDRTIKVWDAATGEVKYTLEGHHDSVWSVAFSPDGKLIASGSDDRTIKVWDAATGEVKRTLEGHHNSVLSVAFSLDGKLIASGSDDRTIKVWDAATGEVKYTLEGHHDSVRSVAFSPDGKLIASGSNDRTIKVWNTVTGEVKRTLEGHGDAVRSVAFSPDGKLIALGSGDETKVWAVATGEVKCTLEGHSDAVLSVAFSPNGKLIVSGSNDWTIKVWDAATGEVNRTLKGHHDSVGSVAFSSDGKLVASGSDDKTIKVWDAATSVVNTRSRAIAKSIPFRSTLLDYICSPASAV